MYVEKCREDIDVLFGNEHRMKGEVVDEQFNKLAKINLLIAVDEPRDTEVTGKNTRSTR